MAYLGSHKWAVADAGGNDVLMINSATGRITTVAVLPHRAFVITRAFAKANHLRSCTVGVTYNTEAVPTDVEAGPNGLIYTSTLPGGPEGPGVGPRARIHTVSLAGAVHEIGRGFDGAPNLAVTPAGVVYVAELSRGVISVVNDGRPDTIFKLRGVIAVEWMYGRLYAATAPAVTGAHSNGEIVVLSK